MFDDVRIIFTSTSGRSGTRYLSNLLNYNATNATAEHDPYPRGYGDPIKWYDKRNEKKLKLLAIKKLDRLNNGIKYRSIVNLPVVREMTNRGCSKSKLYVPFQKFFRNHVPSVEIKKLYLESTHSFIKSFGEVMCDLVSEIIIIHLTRDPLEVATSFFNRSSIPGPNNPYLLDPNFKRNEICISKNMTDFQKCLWYWFESEVRHFTFLDKYEIKKVYDIDIMELNDKDNVGKMFESLHISYNDLSLEINRNSNKISTTISNKHIKEAKNLVESIPSWVFDKIGDRYNIKKRLFG